MASHRNVYKLNDVTEASQLSRELKPTFLSNYQYRDLGSQALTRKEVNIYTHHISRPSPIGGGTWRVKENIRLGKDKNHVK